MKHEPNERSVTGGNSCAGLLTQFRLTGVMSIYATQAET
jgi:hypothetical protein